MRGARYNKSHAFIAPSKTGWQTDDYVSVTRAGSDGGAVHGAGHFWHTTC